MKLSQVEAFGGHFLAGGIKYDGRHERMTVRKVGHLVALEVGQVVAVQSGCGLSIAVDEEECRLIHVSEVHCIIHPHTEGTDDGRDTDGIGLRRGHGEQSGAAAAQGLEEESPAEARQA